jgi:hypothetical protein
MYEVVQNSEIETHPDFVQNRLQPGIERLTVLRHHQGRPDSTKTLDKIRRRSRDEVMRLRGHTDPLATGADDENRHALSMFLGMTTKWEYFLDKVLADELRTEHLNSRAAEGWELVSTSVDPGVDVPVIYLFWRR